MRYRILTALAAAVLCLSVGCGQKRMEKPAFPLSEDVVHSAMEQAGLPGVIAEEETDSSRENYISYSLRDAEQTYFTGNAVLTAGVTSGISDEGRILSLTFPGSPGQQLQFPPAWEEWQPQIKLGTLLYGGFEDEDALYRAFSAQEIPEDLSLRGFAWEAECPGGYAVLTLRVNSIGESSYEPYKRRYNAWLNIYESRAAYENILRRRQENRDLQRESHNMTY